MLIYMPMIPEAVEAMLATVRLGAIHSVVFGGKITKSKVVIHKSYNELSLLVQYINLFVTSKIEFSNCPIVQFSNLKCCIKAKEPFKTPF